MYMDKLQEQLRKGFLELWLNPTEKDFYLELMGELWTAEYYYSVVLEPLGW